MSCDYKEYADLKTVEIVVDGRVSSADFDRIAPQIEAFIAVHGTIRIIEIIHSLTGFDMASLIKGTRFDWAHLKDFSHCAVVTDSGWIGPFTRLLSPLFRVQIRTFSLADEARARDWLRRAS